MVLIWQKYLLAGKMVAFGQSSSYREEVIVFRQNDCTKAKWLYSNKTVCIRAKVDIFGSFIQAMWLFYG